MRKLAFLILGSFLLLSNICFAQEHQRGRTEITEEDLNPSTFPYQLKFPNTSVTDNGDGTTSIDFVGGSLLSTYLKLDASNQASWTPTTTKITNLNADLLDGLHASEVGVTDHGLLIGLLDDDHTQYALLAGRAGGQTLNFGLNAGDNGTLSSNPTATKGKILFGTSAYDEVNNRLGIGTAEPTEKLDVVGNINFNKYKAIAMACDNGTSFPASPATGQWFYRTDIDTLFIYEAAWKAIISFGAVTLYVDKINGSDAVGKGYSSGTGAVATIQYAIDLIPVLSGGNMIVTVAGGTYSENIEIGGKAVSGAYTITIQGVMADQLGTRNVVSSTDTVTTIDGAAMTVNAHIGQQIRITAGTGIGQYAPIIRNTADTITVQNWKNSGFNNIIQSGATPTATSDIVVEDFSTTIKQIRLGVGQQNIILKNAYITGNSSDTNGNIYLRALSNISITGSKIKPTLGGTRGIFSISSSSSIIDNTYIEGGVNSYRGIHLLSGASSFIINTYINSANFTTSGGALYNSGGTSNLLGLRIDGLPANSNGVKLERNGVAIVGFNTATGNSFTSASGTGYDFLAADGGAPNGLFGAWNTVTTYALFVDDVYIQYRGTTETLKVIASAPTKIAQVTKGAASQSANLQEWQKSDGTVYSKIDATGNLFAPTIKATAAAGYISSDGSTGATGTFTTTDLKTVTVKDGIITSIV